MKNYHAARHIGFCERWGGMVIKFENKSDVVRKTYFHGSLVRERNGVKVWKFKLQ